MVQPINENDVMEITIEGTNEGMPWAIVRHYLVTAISSPTDWLATLAGYWESTILANVQTVLTEQWIAECLSISRVAPQPRDVFFYNFAAPIDGDVATDGVANQTCALIRLSTDEVGPRNRGRVYLCGLPESSTNGGLITTAAAAALGTLFAANIAAPATSAGNTCTPCIFSRTSYAINHAAPVANYTSAISGATVEGNLATQRRRRYKRNVTG